ncbi:hypothetical protein [Mesorhizobium sp. LjNodule214]|uniref:hypothetical protein n=1 Tax=Mesorhizobium sp. LjNodule214 TaxID=3342252 RepID=UPI003ECD9C59
MAYKDPPRQDAYRLERVDGETVEGIAIFYTTAEAHEVINHLDRRYRLMLGDRQIWPPDDGNRHNETPLLDD